jgi:hypothetical protein
MGIAYRQTVPLMRADEIMQIADEEIIGFQSKTNDPAKVIRLD